MMKRRVKFTTRLVEVESERAQRIVRSLARTLDPDLFAAVCEAEAVMRESDVLVDQTDALLGMPPAEADRLRRIAQLRAEIDRLESREEARV